MAIDVERLLAEISPEAPCGEDLSYDPALMELERVAQGTPEQQVGDTIVPAEEPNWRDVRNKALELSARTRSLTVLKYLVVSALETEGLSGLADSLAVLRGSLERYWDTLWPQLDPDDAYDPLERMNIISFLSPPPGVYGDPIQFLQRLAKAPLCKSKQLGSYSYRDIQIARGEITPSADGESANVSSIEAAFRDTATEDLDATAAAAQQAADHLAAIDAAITERVGADRGQPGRRPQGDEGHSRRHLRDVWRSGGSRSRFADGCTRRRCGRIGRWQRPGRGRGTRDFRRDPLRRGRHPRAGPDLQLLPAHRTVEPRSAAASSGTRAGSQEFRGDHSGPQPRGDSPDRDDQRPAGGFVPGPVITESERSATAAPAKDL